MAVSLWTGTSGKLDRVPTDDVLRFEREFLEYLRQQDSGVLQGIRETLNWDDDTEQAVERAFNDFAGQFETSEGESIHVGREEHEALPDEEVEQEQIVKQKRA
jgi:F-type H+-transporting ATPase subunit alpha